MTEQTNAEQTGTEAVDADPADRGTADPGLPQPESGPEPTGRQPSAQEPGKHRAQAAASAAGSKPSGILPGLVKGLAATARTLTRHTHTAEYPDVMPKLPPRTRGVIALTEENCTSCMLCARECPDWCIYIDSHKEEIPATTEGGRARQRNVLDRFAIDFSLCMYCGICVEVCPFDALWWSPEFEYAELDIRELVHEKDRLGAWMATVPPPAALDPASADPAELVAASKPPRPARPAAGEGDPAPARVRPARPVPADGAAAAARPRREPRPAPGAAAPAPAPAPDPSPPAPPAAASPPPDPPPPAAAEAAPPAPPAPPSAAPSDEDGGA